MSCQFLHFSKNGGRQSSVEGSLLSGPKATRLRISGLILVVVSHIVLFTEFATFHDLWLRVYGSHEVRMNRVCWGILSYKCHKEPY